MAEARRCPACKTDWPTRIRKSGKGAIAAWEVGYTLCPECRRTTTLVQDGSPLAEDEALSRKKHGDFEEFFREWDEKQARQVAEMEKQFEESPSLEDEGDDGAGDG